MGGGRGQKIEAEFELPEKKPLMILIDDEQGLAQPTLVKDALVDHLAKELKAHKIVEKVTTNEELGLLRRKHPDFDELSIREAGRLANADIMIWMRVLQYAVNDDLDLVVSDGKLAVKLKVFDIREEDPTKIRLWPSQREGKLVDVTVNVHDIRACKTKQQVHEQMGIALADKIAKLFHAHSMEEASQ